MTELMIAGSRIINDNMRDYTIACVKRAKANGWSINVGDNPKGIDALVIDTCEQLCLRYNVYYVNKCRYAGPNANKHDQYMYIEPQWPQAHKYRIRDGRMVTLSTVCMFIWNGESNGTKRGYDYACDLNRTAWLKDFATGVLHEHKRVL